MGIQRIGIIQFIKAATDAAHGETRLRGGADPTGRLGLRVAEFDLGQEPIHTDGYPPCQAKDDYPVSDATHEKYLELAAGVVARLKPGSIVLKTDCWNEAVGHGPFDCAHETVYLEINPGRLAEARQRFPQHDFVYGDIRQIPFVPQYFDAVIDLSTNDHVPDPDRAMAEYHRVLKPDGLLLLVTWFADIAVESMELAEPSDRQYWFQPDDFLAGLKKYFIVEQIVEFPEMYNPEWLRDRPGNRWLQGFICRKT